MHSNKKTGRCSMYIHYYNSPLGRITTASDGKSLTGLWIDGQKYFGSTLEGERLELTQVEYRLLCLLVRSCGRVVTREIILEELWDNAGNFVDDNTLSVYIRRLREKLEENPSAPTCLKTVRGVGYKWEI